MGRVVVLGLLAAVVAVGLSFYLRGRRSRSVRAAVAGAAGAVRERAGELLGEAGQAAERAGETVRG